MTGVHIDDLTHIRARRPEAVAEAAAARARRPLLGDTGRLLILAADHPARGALNVGGRPMAMADRAESVADSRVGTEGPTTTGP